MDIYGKLDPALNPIYQNIHFHIFHVQHCTLLNFISKLTCCVLIRRPDKRHFNWITSPAVCRGYPKDSVQKLPQCLNPQWLLTFECISPLCPVYMRLQNGIINDNFLEYKDFYRTLRFLFPLCIFCPLTMGWVRYLVSQGRPTDIGFLLGKACCLAAGKGRGGVLLFLLFLHFHSFSSFSSVPHCHLSSLFSLSLGDNTK